jgi:hypothetical protein
MDANLKAVDKKRKLLRDKQSKNAMIEVGKLIEYWDYEADQDLDDTRLKRLISNLSKVMNKGI